MHNYHSALDPSKAVEHGRIAMLRSRLALLLGWLMLLPGCTPDSGRMRASGTASYRGEPIENGTLELSPTDGTTGPATGSVIRDGQWEIAADKGPLAGGSYLVRITGVKKTGQTLFDRDRPDQAFEQVANYIPAKHNVESTLKVTMSRKASENELDFDLE